jgi:FixJ family two-component response regulator
MVLTMECAIIDDELIACDRLTEILDGFNFLDVKGVYTAYQKALDNLRTTRPNVLFLDVELDMNHTAFELIDQLHASCYFPYIILITAFEQYSIKAIKKNVFDYVVKPIDIDELKDTISRLQKHISTPFSTLIENNHKLSPREKEILELVMQGKTSHDIADSLYVSKSTVDSHRKNILKKTGASSISDLMRLSRIQ